MKKLFILFLILVISTVGFSQVKLDVIKDGLKVGRTFSKNIVSNELKTLDGIDTTKTIQTQLNAKVTLADSVTGYTAAEVDAIVRSLFTGYDNGNGYLVRVQVKDSILIPTTLRNNLVALWEFDETSGATADAMYGGASLDGTATGGVTVNQNGISGKCYQYNGTTGQVAVSNNAVLNLASGNITQKTFTISTWVKLISTSGVIISKQYDEYKIQPNNGWLRVMLPGRTYTNGTFEGGSLTTGTWYNIIARYNNGTVTVYLNGLLVNTYTVTGSFTASTSSLIFGANDNVDFLNGYIDQTAIWSRVITTDEISMIYGGGTAKPASSW